MASLVRWNFNASNQAGDVWWREMSLEAQLLCEKYLQTTHRGDSKVHFCHRQILYAIDLTRMTQQNLSTGRLRHIQRSEVTFIRPSRQIPPPHATPEAALTAEPDFRETIVFVDCAMERKWRSGIEQSHRR